MKSVSVLIPNFNGRKHLEPCLRSLQEQSDRADEVIIFDNGSSDHSAEYVHSNFPWVRVISAQKNCGFAGALNRAAQDARGEWLAFLNNDMKASPNWICGARGHGNSHCCIASR